MTLTLPGFSRAIAGGDADGLPIIPITAAVFWDVAWREGPSTLILAARGQVNGSAEACRLTAAVGGSCGAWTGIDVTLPATVGLRLPAGGLSANSDLLLIATDAQAGAVLPSPIMVSSAISAANVPRASFTPHIAGAVVAATLALNSPVLLLPGDSAIIQFPGFGLSFPTFQISLPASRTDSKAAWNVTARLLQPPAMKIAGVELTVVNLGKVLEGTVCELTVPSTIGMTLPLSGVSGSGQAAQVLTVSYLAALAAGGVVAPIVFSQVKLCFESLEVG